MLVSSGAHRVSEHGDLPQSPQAGAAAAVASLIANRPLPIAFSLPRSYSLLPPPPPATWLPAALRGNE